MERRDTLKVVYSGDLDVELDKKLIAFIEALGYSWYASGYDFRKGGRDIAFEKIASKVPATP